MPIKRDPFLISKHGVFNFHIDPAPVSQAINIVNNDVIVTIEIPSRSRRRCGGRCSSLLRQRHGERDVAVAETPAATHTVCQRQGDRAERAPAATLGPGADVVPLRIVHVLPHADLDVGRAGRLGQHARTDGDGDQRDGEPGDDPVLHAGDARARAWGGQTRSPAMLYTPPMPTEPGRLLSFDEALRLARGSRSSLHLLVGNGFSMGVHKGFQYDSLYERSKEDLPPRAVKVFERYETSNFELVLHRLHEADWIANLYGLYDQGNDRFIQKDHDSIKAAFMSAIESTHPKQHDIGHEALGYAESFLRNFESVFSICYDLLIYWVMNIRASPKDLFQDGKYLFQDGFEGTDPPYFSPRQELSDKKFVYFLHGALHLIQKDGEIQKIVRNQAWIIDQVRQYMSEGVYPLIITEGNSEEKLSRINSNRYTQWGLNKLKESSGSLFTYGTSLSDPDAHIREAIIKNPNLKSLYIGIHPDETPRGRHDLMSLGEEIREQRELFMRAYDSSTAPVWGPTGD